MCEIILHPSNPGLKLSAPLFLRNCSRSNDIASNEIQDDDNLKFTHMALTGIATVNASSKNNQNALLKQDTLTHRSYYNSQKFKWHSD